jgi:hypothetical protein
MSQELLSQVPDPLRDRACVCERCASGRRRPAEGEAVTDRLTRQR